VKCGELGMSVLLRGIFMVTPCISDIKHFYFPTNEHNVKKRRAIKTFLK